MFTIKSYLRYRKAVFAIYLAAVFFFTLTHFLSGLPMYSVCYSTVMLTFLLLIWIVFDAARFHGNIRRLDRLSKNMNNLTALASLPPADNNLLEQKYREIIAALASVLAQTKAGMEEAQAEQIDYYTMWVHQIKTPITAMRLALQGNGNVNAILEQELFKIEQYAEMVLHYVKIGNLASDLVIKEYSLEDIVRQCIKKYATLFIYKKIAVSVEPMEVTVLTDSKWLFFICEQILSNAIKYTPSGQVTFSAEKNTLIIEDTGIGIRPEDINRVFEKGYTGYNGRLDQRASGIGLYLAKKVADALGIKIQLTSKVGTGTKVALQFPEQKDIWE
ncbi:MAG: HAMP domain-containing histidine kinase [Firmicutes bacterium]|nr:HAMP domain-containing histidine kinase [Bacillota bacterium]